MKNNEPSVSLNNVKELLSLFKNLIGILKDEKHDPERKRQVLEYFAGWIDSWEHVFKKQFPKEFD